MAELPTAPHDFRLTAIKPTLRLEALWVAIHGCVVCDTGVVDDEVRAGRKEVGFKFQILGQCMLRCLVKYASPPQHLLHESVDIRQILFVFKPG